MDLHTKRRICAEALIDARTLERYLDAKTRKSVRASSACRIERAAAALGVTTLIAA